MSFFDLIAELRKGTPDIKKAEKAMKILGWICIVGAAWNFILPQMSIYKDPFHLPPELPYILLISLTLLGVLFFRSARGIREMEPWGKRTGQLAIVLLIGSMLGFMAYGISKMEIMPSSFALIFIFIFMAQFGIPAYFGIRYLGRLPVEDGSYASYQRRKVEAPTPMTGRESGERAEPQAKYKDSPSRFGVYGTLFLLIAVPLLIALLVYNYYRNDIIVLIFPLIFLFVFFSPIIYNYFPSPFQEQRNLVSTFTGGGSIFLFGGSWPFFRLLIYEDAVEIRTMFQRYLIPYDKLADLQEKIGFFTMGILFKSDLPGVPSRIRFQGFGMKKILKLLNETRDEYLGRTA